VAVFLSAAAALGPDLPVVHRPLARGLAAAATRWPPIELAYGWVHRAAHILGNDAAKDGDVVRAAYARLLTEMRARWADAGPLAPAIDHFLKVTDSYAPGLFHSYAVDGLPLTGNDLEPVFGTGHKVASAALVMAGGAKADLRLQRPADLARWRQLRAGSFSGDSRNTRATVSR